MGKKQNSRALNGTKKRRKEQRDKRGIKVGMFLYVPKQQ